MIGKVIYSILSNNVALTTLVASTNMYPYIANEDSPLPLIIYTIDSVESDYDKDGWATDDVKFSVSSFSDDYAELQSIVDAIRNALELTKGVIEGYTINRIYLNGFTEGYNINENVFANRLNFIVTVQKY
jgi:hypothetical protein